MGDAPRLTDERVDDPDLEYILARAELAMPIHPKHIISIIRELQSRRAQSEGAQAKQV